VATVLDEGETIDELLHSMALQTRPPDEVVIVDGGSRDGTWERLLAWNGRLPLRPLRAEGANIARGRNMAIGAARGELIAVTDAGVRLDPRWLEQLLARLRPRVDVVAGFFRPDTHTAFEVAMGATVLPDRSEIKPESFLPSSRSVLFRRSAWEAAGGYPDWLDYCEDLVFDLALRRAGCRFVFAPEAVARFRPRGSLRAFFRQYFLYARGDGKAGLWRTRHAVRYATYLGAPTLLLARPRAWSWLLLLAGAGLYVRRPYARLARELGRLEPAAAAYTVALVPIIRAVGDVAKMLGYPAGVAWRLRSRSASP
jgi:glycosyltransferase involved in cell wall biosynthesis